MADGTLVFSTKLLAEGFKAGVEKINEGLGGLKGKLTSLSKAIGAVFGVNWFVSAVKGTNKICGELREVAESLTPLIRASATVNALNAQMEQTFGTFLGSANEAISRVADSSGMLESRLRGVGTQIYAFAKAGGMDSVTALGLMEDALQVAADSAAYYDRSLDETAESLRSFLKGLYMNDAALGVSCTEVTRNTMANKLYGKSYMQLSEAQKQLTLLQMVKEANDLSGATGQAAREAQNWENVTGNLNGAWRQLLATLGQPVLMIAIDGVQRMTAAVEMLAKWAGAAVDALSDLFGWEYNQTAAISGNIANSVDNQNALTEAVAETEKAQKGSLAAFDELNILTSKDDDSAEDSGNSGTAAIIPTVSENAVEKAADDLRKRFENLLEPIKIAWEDESPTIFENAKRAVNAIKSLILSIGESIEEVFTNGSGEQLAKNILKIFGNLLGIIGDIAIALEIAWDSGGTGTDLVQSYIDWWTALTGLINRFAEDFREVWNDGASVTLCTNILRIITGINKTVSNLVDKFAEAWEESDVGQRIISKIFELLNKAVDTIADCAEKAAEWASEVDFAPLLESVLELLNSIQPIWNAFWDGIEWAFKYIILPYLKALIEDQLPGIILFISSLFDTLDGFFTWLGDVFAGAPGFFSNLLKNIKEFFDNIWGKLEEFGGWLYEKGAAVIDWFGEKWNGIKEIFSGVGEWFTGKFTEAHDGITGIFSGIGDWFGDRWENIKEKFEIVGDWFGECFTTAVNYITEVFTPIVNFFGDIWSKIKAVFAKVGSWFGEKFKAAWDKITAIFDKAKEYFSEIWNAIKGVFISIGSWFGNKFQQAWDKITAVFDGAKAYFSAVWEGIKGIFSHVTDWFRDKFTEAWEAVKYVFSNGGAIFDGIVDGIFNVFRDVVNSLIYGINCIIWEPFNAINAALDGIRGVEIMGFTPFEWLPYINIPQIPYLAQGTVVPANYGNFLAVLGDNKREAEVVSPISSIEKAVENVLARHGMPKEITVVTYLYPNSAAYHREIIKIVNDDNRRKGL